MMQSVCGSTYAVLAAAQERERTERRSRTVVIRPQADVYLNLLSYGAIVASSKLTLFRANTPALEMLSRADAVKLRRGCLTFTRAEYQRLVVSYVSSNDELDSRLTFRMERSNCPNAYVVQIRPHADQRASLPAAQFLIAIYQPAPELIVAPDVLQAAYGLSAAEARVASEIARSDKLTSVARALDLSANTVRTHAKRIFRKLSISTQAQLIQLLASGPR